MKLLKRQNGQNIVVDAEDKFSHYRESRPPQNINELAEHAIRLLNDENIEISKVRPFFWSLVETYVDRFQQFPFDIEKAVFCYLEIKGYPRDEVESLVRKIESQFETQHGQPLRKSAKLLSGNDSLEDEMKSLRDTLKYAAMVAEATGTDGDNNN